MQLTNSFHGTTYTTRMTEKEIQTLLRLDATGRPNDPEYKAAKRKIRKIWKVLCGIENCTCGDSLGRR